MKSILIKIYFIIAIILLVISIIVQPEVPIEQSSVDIINEYQVINVKYNNITTGAIWKETRSEISISYIDNNEFKEIHTPYNNIHLIVSNESNYKLTNKKYEWYLYIPFNQTPLPIGTRIK